MTTLPDQKPQIVVTAYNLWYLLRLGNIHQVPSSLHPAGLPWTDFQLGVAAWLAFVTLVAVLLWRRRGTALAVPAALLCLGLFMLLPHIRERYLLAALPFLLLAAADGTARRRTGGRGSSGALSCWPMWLSRLRSLSTLPR